MKFIWSLAIFIFPLFCFSQKNDSVIRGGTFSNHHGLLSFLYGLFFRFQSKESRLISIKFVQSFNFKKMKQVTLSVPDEKYSFFIELMNSIDFVSIEDFPPIPEEHKAIVMERIKKSTENPDLLLDWDEVKDNFKFK